MTTLTVSPYSSLLMPQRSHNRTTPPAPIINLVEECRQEILLTPSITPQNSHLSDDNSRSLELLERLCDQKCRLIELYDAEIERQQSSPELLTFLNQIDQLLQDYTTEQSANLIIRNYPSASLRTESFAHSSPLPDDPTDTITQLKDSLIVPDESPLGDSSDVRVYDLEHKEPVEPSPNITNIETIHTNQDDDSSSKISRTIEAADKKSTVFELQHYKCEECPLTTRTYGFDATKHGLHHFPCTHVVGSIILYTHLVSYHHLTYSTAMRIIRLLVDENEKGDIDLFSSKSTRLTMTRPTLYRAQCPLNEYGKFGITAKHKIRLCVQSARPYATKPKDVYLYTHFVTHHQMKRSCAQRLVKAIVKNKTEKVFRPNEELLDSAYYVQCPLQHSRANCWKSPIAAHKMSEHLTDVHKVDCVTRRQILSNLRKQRSSSNKK